MKMKKNLKIHNSSTTMTIKTLTSNLNSQDKANMEEIKLFQETENSIDNHNSHHKNKKQNLVQAHSKLMKRHRAFVQRQLVQDSCKKIMSHKDKQN